MSKQAKDMSEDELDTMFSSKKKEEEEEKEEPSSQGDQKVSLDFQSVAEIEEETPKFHPLKENIYKLSVKEASIVERLKYQSSEMGTYIQLVFYVDAVADDSPIFDINGEEQEPSIRQLWESLDTDSLGFRPDGEPSKTRACICALTNQDPTESFSFDDVESLVGLECKAFVSVGVKADKVTKKNKVTKYMAL